MSRDDRKNGHLTDEALERLRRRTAGVSEKTEALAHIAVCEFCAARFADGFSCEDLLDLPPQFDEGVRRKLDEVRITATPLSLTRRRPQVPKEQAPTGGKEALRDKKKEYRRYSCRVAIAACLALLLLFSGTFATGFNAISRSRVLNPDLSRVNQLTQSLSEFSKDLFHWEVKNND